MLCNDARKDSDSTVFYMAHVCGMVNENDFPKQAADTAFVNFLISMSLVVYNVDNQGSSYVRNCTEIVPCSIIMPSLS